jgi:hypothetical protein
VLADCLLRRPAVQFLCATVPVVNDVVHIADEDSVVGEIEQACLLSSLRDLLLQIVTGLQKLSFDAAPDGAEPGEQQSKQDKDKIVGDINPGDIEGVTGLGKEVVEGEAGENDRHHCRPQPRIPNGESQGKQEEREFYSVEVVTLQQERQSER